MKYPLFVLMSALSLSLTTTGLCNVYFVSPNGKATNQATQDSPWSLDKANAEAKAADTVILLDGSYEKPIAPTNNGEAGKPITFKALNAKKAIFEGTPFDNQEAIVLSDRSYIAIDAVTVKAARRFIFAEGQSTHHIAVKDCWFEHASNGAWESSRFRNVGDGICVSNCHITGGNDLLAITGGKNHLVENNFFGDASHTGLVLIMVQQSVVRANTFTNHQGKMMEVFNTRDVKEPHRLSEYNLIDGNIFDSTAGSAIQYAGSRTILRRNIFRHCTIGMDWSNYMGRAKNPEAWYGESNRFYNNVLYDCGPASVQTLNDRGIKSFETKPDVYGVAMHFATNRIPPTHYGDERCINNILYRNTGGGDKTARTAQVSFNWDASPVFGSFFYNDIIAQAPDAPVFYWLDAPHEKPPVKQNMTLNELQEKYPKSVSRNVQADPQFVDADKGDFHLKPTSPCIDAGGPLTTVTVDSDGKTVKVADALYFTDGYGIAGVEGDLIHIGSRSVRVIKVNFQTNELTLNEPIRCTAGTPINLNYLGRGPDMGAFECK